MTETNRKKVSKEGRLTVSAVSAEVALSLSSYFIDEIVDKNIDKKEEESKKEARKNTKEKRVVQVHESGVLFCFVLFFFFCTVFKTSDAKT